jgi:hypothetical protein
LFDLTDSRPLGSLRIAKLQVGKDFAQHLLALPHVVEILVEFLLKVFTDKAP